MFGKRVVLILVVALMALGLGVSSSWAARPPYVIGAIFSTTGDNAPLGVPERETVQMLAAEVNKAGGIGGRRVEVEFYDDGGSPQQAVQACSRLLANKNVVAIIGPTLSGPSLAIAQMCQDAKMPFVSCAASAKIVVPVRSYVFKTAQSDSLAVEKIISYLKAKKITSVGFINDANAFGASGREQWLAISGRSGIKTVAMESFASSDTDMTSQLTKIRSQRPGAVICWGTNPGPAMVARGVKRLGMKMPLIMSHGVANMKFIELSGSAAEGVVFPAGKLIVAKDIPNSDPQKRQLLDYAADFQGTYGKAPNTFGGHAWDAFNLVVEAVRKAGTDKVMIRKAIENRRQFVGISGVFRFSPQEHNGLDISAFTFVQIKGGKWTIAK
jgi:branched-chain amino acid transport system substrate-binding protein